MALLGAGMSMLWIPKDPFGVRVYVGYSLLNVLDPKAGGAMIEAIQAEGKPTWLDQIRDHFLHPTSASFAAYANTVLGEDNGDGFDDTIDPTREEVIVLLSEGSDRSLGGLTPHSARAGPVQGVANEPVIEHVDVDVDVEVPVETAEELETRRKKKLEKSEGKEKRAEEKATETPRKCPSTLHFLDYVVVSDTLYGLGTREKRGGHDPDDSATLTEMMKKKSLEDKKRKLSRQLLCWCRKERNSRRKLLLLLRNQRLIWKFLLQNMGTCWKKYSWLLVPVLSQVSLLARLIFRKLLLPPLRLLELLVCPLPLRIWVRRSNKFMWKLNKIGEGGGDGAGGAGDDGRGKGVDTKAESSEATHRQTIYTRRPPASSGGAASGVPRGHEFKNFQGGSWDTHNPSCDDLPHAPRWNLTQGSRMNDHDNFREFFSLSLSPAGRLFQKRRNRFDLLDDHIHVGVNFFAIS
ncbi:hypothetical protein Hanom_Chr10g00912561 [Helianthus anomalus]